ncbi:MAG: hypothetical protein N2Z72_00225, partial [Bacteroidales bacterium]|nr:hypothetical protein [Bacteroidales bacterium]
MRSKFFIVFFLVLTIVKANNVRVTNITRTGSNRDIIEFRLSWQNSWYFVTGFPQNHDAVWVFIKFRQCETSGQWNHALLSVNMTDHFFDDSLTYAKPITTLDRYGNPGQHNTGVLIRRKYPGQGHIVNKTVRLKVVGSTQGIPFDETIEYDIKVFA